MWGLEESRKFIHSCKKHLLSAGLALGSVVSTPAIQPGMGVQAESALKAIELLKIHNISTLDGK